jgi:HEAT repeat protein
MTARLIAYHIERLRNKNRDTRLDAINELRLLGNPQALEPLEQVYRNDPDADVRKAAQAAGLEIFMKNRSNKPS